MNEVTPPPQTPVGQSPQENFGTRLHNARLAAGMDVVTLAARLRLHPKQVEALERCDLDALPGPIYVRGFLRGCARELKIDPQILLDDLDRRAGVQPGALPAPTGRAFRRIYFGDGTKPIVAILIFVLVLAGLVGTLIPRHPTPPVQSSTPQVQEPAPTPAANPPAPETTPPAAPQTAAEVAPAPTPAAAEGPGAPHAPQAPQAPDLRPSTAPPSSRAAPIVQSAAVPAAVVPGKPAGASTANRDATHAADTVELVLRVHAEAWIEVVQSDGTTLLSQVCAPGTIQTIKGKEPLHLVIGNPGGVDALFHGVPVDLARFTSPNGVARLTLE